jgi:hypothetical protein
MQPVVRQTAPRGPAVWSSIAQKLGTNPSKGTDVCPFILGLRFTSVDRGGFAKFLKIPKA